MVIDYYLCGGYDVIFAINFEPVTSGLNQKSKQGQIKYEVKELKN